MSGYIASGTCARFAMAKPDDVPLTFSLTLKASEWRALMRELGTEGCSQTLGQMISTMLGELTGRMEATYESTGWSGAKPLKDQP